MMAPATPPSNIRGAAAARIGCLFNRQAGVRLAEPTVARDSIPSLPREALPRVPPPCPRSPPASPSKARRARGVLGTSYENGQRSYPTGDRR